MSRYITTYYICEKCQRRYEFSDDKNTPGIRLIRCQHFTIKFIRNTDEYNLRFFVSLKCGGCSNKQDIKKIDIIKNYNKNDKDLKYNIYSCCQNIILIGAFYSEVESETINNIINLSDYNDFLHMITLNNHMNNNNTFKNNESNMFNNNRINNNRYSANEINSNGYISMEQKELNNLKGSLENKELFDMNNNNNISLSDYYLVMEANNMLMNNNNNIGINNNNINNNMMNNNMANNNMININNNMMNNMMNNNMMNNMMNNNMNNNMGNNNMMNNNMNNNIMNHNMMNNNMHNSQNDFNNNYNRNIINFKS